MIVVGNIKNVNVFEYDVVWACVRSMRHSKQGVTQVAELSPSWELFSEYRKLARAGNWNKETFTKVYVPKFLEEMKSKSARDRLNQLWKLDKRGYKVFIGCFCDDEELCHRSILAGLLQGVGSDVHAKREYKEFYNAI